MSINEHFLIKDFKRLIGNGGLSQAYLLFGESDIVRREIGLGILKLLENSNKDQQGFLRDGFILEQDISGSIGIDAVRGAINFLWQRPVVSSRRALFIDNADCLTSQAENALLKTIEEPPEHGLIVFSVLSAESLIAPLVSRCQKIFVAGARDTEVYSIQDAKRFINGTTAMRKLIIAQTLQLESHVALLNFVRGLLVVCQEDPIKNFELMRRITDRWAKMCQFNVNKKLQLETLLG